MREKEGESGRGYRLCLLARLQDINISVNVVRKEREKMKLEMYSLNFEARERYSASFNLTIIIFLTNDEDH